MNPRRALYLCLLAGAVAAPAQARVSRLEIRERVPFEGGRSFGSVGPYERIRGTVHFEVDPRSKANRPVVDLNLAPRNGKGRVEFSADFEILTPADPGRANGTLLYDVNNRGGRTALGMFNGGADGFLMRQGYTVAASGWIAEVLPGDDRLRLQAPQAYENGKLLTGKVRAEMVPDAPATRLDIAQWGNQGSYPPTERGLQEATLTVRERERDQRTPIPRDRWRLERIPVSGSMLPRVELVLEGGFQPGSIYELIYEAEGSVVQGLGLAGIRDLVSFLKHDRSPENPLAHNGKPAVSRAIGFGVSQSGRCLRQLVYDGFNADERGRIVFEGLWPHVAGAGMGFFNHRFASPTRHNAQHDNHLYPADVFPFTYGEEKDPFTGRTDGILRKARAQGVVPKVFHTQTSAEYWHRSGSLVHTDPRGVRDAVLPDEVRIYAIGGAQHGPGSGIPGPKGNGELPANPTDYRPLLRGLLVALNEWVASGKEPPPSRYPRLQDGTLGPWQEPLSGWKAIPGVRYPTVIQQPEWLDHGPEFLSHRRLTILPPRRLGLYGVRVPLYASPQWPLGDVDVEQGMLDLPSVAVPVGTFTGWNLRGPRIGAEGELLSLTGGYIPFARTRAEREHSGDPRPSLEERYGLSFDRYLGSFQAWTDRLIRERYLLDEDRERLLGLARSNRALLSP